jgi:dienelactone hydrolase
MSSSRLLTLLVAASSLAACSSETQPVTQAKPPEIVARFTPGSAAMPPFLDIPFPSDVYLDPDGTIVDALPGLEVAIPNNTKTVTDALASQKGFGINAGALFRVDRAAAGADAPAVDAASLPADEAASVAEGSSVVLVDLDATDPAAARVPCRVAFHDDRPRGSDSPPVISVLPARGVVLAEGHRHAAVLTTKVTADGGKALGASEAFQAIRDGSARKSALEKMYGDAVDAVAAKVPALADKTKIAGIAVFTTQKTADELLSMRAAVAKLSPPTLSWEPQKLAPMGYGVFGYQAFAGYTATLDDWLGAPAKLPDGGDDPARDQQTGAAHDAVAAIGTAVFDAPNFLLDQPMGYLDPTHANVARDAAGQPVINPAKPTSKVWVTLALPKGPVPAGGFPVIILQHGLQGDRSFILTLANTFAKQGWATAAIESVTFGARSPAASNTVDQKSNFPWSAGAKYSGPDGFVDTSASAINFFGAFFDFGAPRDQLRQSVVDVGTLADVLASPALDLGPLLAAVPGAKLSPARIGYVGDSFGSVMGAMVASIDPRVNALVLNVGGGGILTELVSNAPWLASLVGTAGGLNFGLSHDRLDESHPLVHLLQSILDPADPLSHARRIVQSPATVNGVPNAKKSVILVEALWDELVANEGSEALARVAGMPLAVPNAGTNGGVTLPEAKPGADGSIHDVPAGGVTAVVVQASPATHGSDLYNAHGVRHYQPPFHQAGDVPFPVLPKDIPVREPYLGLQAMSVPFFQAYFAGAVPVVKGFPAPRRDFDDDGVDDAEDKLPFDPTQH